MFNAMNSIGARGTKKSRVDLRENRALFSMEEETAIPVDIRRFRDDSGKIISAESYEALQKNTHASLNEQPVPEHAPKVYAKSMQEFIIYSDQLYISGIQTRLSLQQAYSDISEILDSQDIQFCPTDLNRTLQSIRSTNSGGNNNFSITLLLKKLYVFKVAPNILKGEKRICQMEFGRPHAFKTQQKSYASASAVKSMAGIQYVFTALDRHFSPSANVCAVLTNGSWDEDVLSQQVHGAHVFFSKIMGLIADYYEISVVAIPFWAPVINSSPDSGYFRTMVIAVFVCKNTYSNLNAVIRSEGMKAGHLTQWWTELGFMMPQAEAAPDFLTAPIAAWTFFMVKTLSQVKQCPLAPDLNCFYHTWPSIRIDTGKNILLSDIIETLQQDPSFPADAFLYAVVQQMWIPRFLRSARSYGDVFWLYFNKLEATELPIWDQHHVVNGHLLEISREDMFNTPGAQLSRSIAQQSYTSLDNRRCLPLYLSSHQYNFISCTKMLIFGPQEYMISLIGEVSMTQSDGSELEMLDGSIGSAVSRNEGRDSELRGMGGRAKADPPFKRDQYTRFVASMQVDGGRMPESLRHAPASAGGSRQLAPAVGSFGSQNQRHSRLSDQASTSSSSSTQLVVTPQSHIVSSVTSSYESLAHIDGKFDLMMSEMIKLQTQNNLVVLQLRSTQAMVEDLRKEVRGSQVGKNMPGDDLDPVEFIYSCDEDVERDPTGNKAPSEDGEESDSGPMMDLTGAEPAPTKMRKSLLPVSAPKRTATTKVGGVIVGGATKPSAAEKISEILDSAFTRKTAGTYSKEINTIRNILSRVKAINLLTEFLEARPEIKVLRERISRGQATGMAIGIIPYVLKVMMQITSEGAWPPEPIRSLQTSMLASVCSIAPSKLGGGNGLFFQPSNGWGEVDILIYCGHISLTTTSSESEYAQLLPRKWFDRSKQLRNMESQRYLIGDLSTFLPIANFQFANLPANHLSFDTRGFGGMEVINNGFSNTVASEIFIIYDPNRFLPFIQSILIRMMASNLWNVSLMCTSTVSVSASMFMQKIAEQIVWDIPRLPSDWHFFLMDTPQDIGLVEGDIGAISQWARGHSPPMSPWLIDLLRGKDRSIFDLCVISNPMGQQHIRAVTAKDHGLDLEYCTVPLGHPIYEIAWGDEIILPTPSDADSDYVSK